MLAKYIVGLFSLRCLINFLLFSWHSQCFFSSCVICAWRCGQLMPSIPPPYNFFQLSGFVFFPKEHNCKSGKTRETCKCPLCTVDVASCFLDIRLGPKTSVYRMKVIVVSTATDCDVTYCATTLQGFNKHASLCREAVSHSRGVPRCTEKISKSLRLLTCVDRSTHPIDHPRIHGLA